jgi:V/A-type H+-transporting ATPase subunit I
MLQKMKKIQVIGPRKDIQGTVDLLYRLGVIHLEDISECISKEEICLKKVEIEKGMDIAGTLVKIDGIFYTLPGYKGDVEKQEKIKNELGGKSHEKILERSQQIIDELEWTTKDFALRKSDLEFVITSMDKYEKVIDKIRHIEPELPALEGYEVNILIIQKEYEGVLNIIRKELVEITRDQFEFIHTDVDEESMAAIAVFNKKYSDQVHAFLFSANVNEVRLPPEFTGMTFSDMLRLIGHKRIEAAEEISAINKKLEELSAQWYQELFVLKGLLEDINQEAITYNKFGQSDYTFVIMGWIPAKYLKKTRKALKDSYNGRVVIEELKLTPEDLENAPTCYDNPGFVKPFEFLMQLVRPPKYLEVDPSPLIAIFFPIFFGIMVGDIGYGIIILALSLLVRKKFEKVQWLKDFSGIMIISSIPATFFGFLFGEFFGDLGEHMHLIHPVCIQGFVCNRVEAIVPMLIFVIIIGVIHVFLGLVIGLLNAITIQSKKHILEKTGMISILTGLLIISGCFAGLLPGFAIWVAGMMMLLSFPMIIYGGGVYGAIEMVSAVGNIMSYARLMAIGMASVILAIVANKLGGSIGIVAMGILVAVSLHALNVALAIFSPSIHALRLHLVEFFSKFYEGGGRQYIPFKKVI